jgi:drug/metabolite transporter (DMT)-like permease
MKQTQGAAHPLNFSERFMAASSLTVGKAAVDTSNRELKNHLFVSLAVIANTLGNFLLSVGMRSTIFKPWGSPLEYLRIFANPWIDAGVVLLLVWFAAQLSLLSWADLSYVLPITAASYVLTAVFGKVFLHEFISLSRWFGILAISMGVLLVIGTSPRARLGAREIVP